MFLSDETLRNLCEDDNGLCKNLTKESIQPASIDCRISNNFAAIDEEKGKILRFDSPVNYRNFQTDSFILKPHSFILASTMEHLNVPNDIAGFVDGRTSLGRMGVLAITAGWIDPGYNGVVTLQLFNTTENPIELVAGQRIGQFVFASLDTAAQMGYNGKYQNSVTATGSKMFMDAKN